MASLRCPFTEGGGCQSCFSDDVLHRALPAKEFKRYTSRSAALHAIAAGIEGLAPCPACDFMVEMGGSSLDEGGVIRCLSQDCGRVSCRKCGLEDHRPLRCDEVEKDSEVKLRTFLEEQMTNATARRCSNRLCRKVYEKIEGCNKITCSCGTSMCYLCGTILDSKRPYDHFKDGSRGGGTNSKDSSCTIYGEPAWAKAKKSAQAARSQTEESLRAFLAANPELQGLEGGCLQKVRRQVGLGEDEMSSAPPPSSHKKRRIH